MNEQYQNIPAELRTLRQWVCFRYETNPKGKPTKVPYNPTTGRHANVIDAATWCDFDTVCRAPGYDGIGLVLTDADPYAIIDLDDKPDKPASVEDRQVHDAILRVFQTYTERSVSGSGYHIVARGKLPNGVRGMRRGTVEVYTSQRYMVFTGATVSNLPIVDCSHLLENMATQMEAANSAKEDAPLEDGTSDLNDRELFEMALGAVNGELFDFLTRYTHEEMQTVALGRYASPSDADAALVGMLAFYTRDNEQVKRIFSCTPLGKRDKMRDRLDDLLNRLLRHVRRNDITNREYEAAQQFITSLVTAQAPAAPPPAAPVPPAPPTASAPPPPSVPDSPPLPPMPDDFVWPPGFLGDVARHFYAASVRPVKQFCAAGALSLFSGICGRQYNISRTGLNTYILVIAPTGTGKDELDTMISGTLKAVTEKCGIPLAEGFIGPASFASGQAVMKSFENSKSYVSVLSEFGMIMRAIKNERASPAEQMIKRALLDLFLKSGWDKTLRSTVYSDSDKNTQIIRAPALSFIADTTPGVFYDTITPSDLEDGFIPRVQIVEYEGIRAPLNPNRGMPMPEDMLKRIADVCLAALQMENNQQPACVVSCNADAQQMLDEFGTWCDAHINTTLISAEREVWNRAHIKALRFAALAAVADNPHAPTITIEHAKWACWFIGTTSERLREKFFKGDIGSGDTRQFAEVRRLVEEYFKYDTATLKKYRSTRAYQKAGVIPFAYLLMRAHQLGAFTHDKRGATRCVKSTVESMCDTGMLVRLDPVVSTKNFGTRAELYTLGTAWPE